MADATPNQGGTVTPPPDFAPLAEKLRHLSLTMQLAIKLLDDPRWFAAVMRRVWPIACVGKGALVTRYDDVMEILGRDEDFPVPFGPKFKMLDRTGENFILGMERDDTYRKIHAEAMGIFSLKDLPRIAKFSADRAEALVAAGNGEIDCVADLLTRVPVEIVADYFGIGCDDPDFALWLLAMNYNSFPHLTPSPDVEPAARAAAQHVGPLVDDAIRSAKAAPNPDTILGRFVTAKAEILTDDVIRATIIGFILGFVPTNNRASGQIMEWLLKHPDAMSAAEAAARSGDDNLLGRVLFEALRFHPINPGPFRLCKRDTVVAAGTSRATTIRAGTMILVSTQSASFDPRRVPEPNRFDPSRGVADTMRFGWGQHWCIGYGIAIAQITQTFKPLLRRGRLRRAPGKRGQPAWFGPFYEHLFVTYKR
jgi:cytochrome P450